MDRPPSPIEAPAPSRKRPGLLVAGILLVLAPLLYVNPFEISGTSLAATGTSAWPWERFATAPFAHAVEVTALFVLGIFSILAGVGVGGRRLLLGILSAGVFYAIRHHGTSDAYGLVSAESFGLSGFLAATALFAGCLLLRSPSEGSRPVGRVFATGGAVLGIVLAVGCFPKTPPIPDVNLVQEFVARAPARLDTVLARGIGDADSRRRDLSVDVVGRAVPELGFGIAVLFALVAAARARPGERRTGSRMATAALVALLLVWTVPPGWALAAGVAESLRAGIGTPLQPVVAAVAALAMEAGFALFLLIGVAIAHLAPSGAVARGIPPRGDPSRVSRAGFAGALVVACLSLWIAFRPEVGLFARERAWTILGGGLRWDREVATLCAIVGSILLAIVGLVRGRGGAGVVIGVAAVAFVAEHAIRILSNSPTATYLDVTAYVPFALAAIAAATAGKRTPGARATCAVAALTLLAIFAEPRLTGDPIAGSPGGTAYVSLWTFGATESRSVADYLFGFVPDHGCPAVVAWLSLVAIAALASLRSRGAPRGVRIVWALFLVAAVWPLAQIAFVAPPLTRFESSSAPVPGSAERTAALAVFLFLGTAFALFGALSQRSGERNAA